MYVHCGTVYNSKDLEPTQMSINNRLDKENAAHIHHGILHSHKKQWVRVLHRDMDEPGDYHSQQTDIRTENEIPHILTHRRVLNNENTWTQEGEHYTLGSIGGNRGGIAVGGELGRDIMGRNTRYRWRGGRQQITLPCVYLCNNLACSAHVPQNLKCNKNLKKKKTGFCLPHCYNTSQLGLSQLSQCQIGGNHERQKYEILVNYQPALKTYICKWWLSGSVW